MSDENPVRKLEEITEAPAPDAELAAAAEAEGATIVPYAPSRLEDFVTGKITLGELEGVGKDAQYEMAQLGHGYLEQGKLDLARNVFAGLVALDPFDAYFHTALGSVEQLDGNLERAEECYGAALGINPFATAAWANRGEVRLQLGRLEDAATDLVKAIETDPECAEPATQRARALAENVRQQLEEAGLSADDA